MKARIIFLVLLTLFVTASCQAASEPTAMPVPTEAPKPTAPPPPTAEPTAEPTATPMGQIFRDDFVVDLQPGWTWVNEVPENHSISTEGLRIISDDACLLGAGFQNNLLIRDAPQDISFTVETKLTADTQSNFQQASLFLYEDAQNYYSVNRGYCGICHTQGDGIFSDYMFHNEMSFNFKGIKIDTDDVYLKLEVDREGKWLINYYATEAEQWIQLRKVPLLIDVQKIAIGSGNCDGGQFEDNLTAFFDYVEIKELE